jgi:hypothetical protein
MSRPRTREELGESAREIRAVAEEQRRDERARVRVLDLREAFEPCAPQALERLEQELARRPWCRRDAQHLVDLELAARDRGRRRRLEAECIEAARPPDGAASAPEECELLSWSDRSLGEDELQSAAVELAPHRAPRATLLLPAPAFGGARDSRGSRGAEARYQYEPAEGQALKRERAPVCARHSRRESGEREEREREHDGRPERLARAAPSAAQDERCTHG